MVLERDTSTFKMTSLSFISDEFFYAALIFFAIFAIFGENLCFMLFLKLEITKMFFRVKRNEYMNAYRNFITHRPKLLEIHRIK